MNNLYKVIYIAIFILAASSSTYASAQDTPVSWHQEWPQTDFAKTSVHFSQITSGGPPKDGIPAIDDPAFLPITDISDIGDKEPVIVLHINGDARAYPLRILMWHEIVNDIVGGEPALVTYCPLCNAAVVFKRKIDNKIYDFGVSGKLRYSDMVMYDRQTQSWWQQYLGEAIVGTMTGTQLERIPSDILPFQEFKKRWPRGKVLSTQNLNRRSYGINPYKQYDSQKWPILFNGEYNSDLPPLAYVIAVDDQAWPLENIRQKKIVRYKDMVITWHKGMNSALDDIFIKKGRDIGYVSVTKEIDGKKTQVAYDMIFAFVFKAFYPDGMLHLK